mmetsp:Transcript_15142/g.21585  ORF Transcript_15142/g.21585 Transcript_15142/m.21585 type:complete len:113 (-) Transcript_15142:127-465(-)
MPATETIMFRLVCAKWHVALSGAMPTTNPSLARHVGAIHATALLDDGTMSTADSAIDCNVSAFRSKRASLLFALEPRMRHATHSQRSLNVGASGVVARLLLGTVPLTDPAIH